MSEYERLKTMGETKPVDLGSENTALRKENELLVGELKKIANWPGPDLEHPASTMRQIAQKALSELAQTRVKNSLR